MLAEHYPYGDAVRFTLFIGGVSMRYFKPNQKVHTVSSMDAVNDISRFLLPSQAHELLNSDVTILDQPIEGWPLYRIHEDGGHHLYPCSFFLDTTRKKPKGVHHWSDKELEDARSLICRLLVAPDGHLCPDASYRFVDLVTPYKLGKMQEGKPRVMLIRTSLKGLDIKVYTGVASDYDEPNVLIGMAVCLCKAKDVKIPDWIMHPGEKKETYRCH